MENQNIVPVSHDADSKTTKPAVFNTMNYDKIITTLSEEQRQEYLRLASEIDTENMTSIRTYGSGLNHRIDKANDYILSQVTSSCGTDIEASSMSKKVFSQLNSVDFDRIGNDSKLKRIVRRVPLLKNLMLSAQDFIEKTTNVLTTVEKITDKMQNVKTMADADNNTLKSVKDNIKGYLADIRDLIIGAKLKREELVEELNRMKSSGAETFDIAHMTNVIDSLDKRIDDMRGQESMLSINLLQIEVMMKNNYDLADGMENFISNIIPMWKQQAADAIYVERQRCGFEMKRIAQEGFNNLIVETSRVLHDNAIEATRQSEEQMIHIETIEKCAKDLVDMTEQINRIKVEAAKQHGNKELIYQSIGEKLQALQ